MRITRFLQGPCALMVAVIVLAGVAPAQTIPTWVGSFVFTDPNTQQMKTYFYVMVGTNPALGPAKTKVPVVIVPVKIKFPDGTRLNPNVNDCGDTDTPLNRTLNSPIFQTTAFAAGGTPLGVTQYNDAVQRASFWSQVSQADYHVLLKQPLVEPVQTLTIPQPPPGQPALGSTSPGVCDPWGFVDFNTFDSYAQGLLTALQIPPSSLAIFLAYNTDFTTGPGRADLGYHNVAPSQQTYIVTSFFDPYRFGPNQADVSNLSHEVGEWMADPFVGNPTPLWFNGQGCQDNMEPGDPPGLGASAVFLNGFTYHLQELVFLSWFARQNPSTGVNQWYSFNNSLTSAPPVCQ